MGNTGNNEQGIARASDAEDLSFARNFSTPASMTLPYPGLDGHPRRITPIPVSLPMLPTGKTSLRPIPEPPSKPGWYWSELSERWFKTPELLEKERLAGEQANAEEEVESSI